MEGSKLKRAVFLIVAIHVLGSILVGCGPSAIKVGIVPWKMETSRDDGSQREVFYSFSSPRTSHPPGYVFRTSEASPSDIWVTTLAAQEKIEETSNPLTETEIEVSANAPLKPPRQKY